MDKSLGKELVKRNIIKQDTEVDAWYPSSGIWWHGYSG